MLISGTQITLQIRTAKGSTISVGAIRTHNARSFPVVQQSRLQDVKRIEHFEALDECHFSYDHQATGPAASYFPQRRDAPLFSASKLIP